MQFARNRQIDIASYMSAHRSSGESTQNMRSTTVVIWRPRMINTLGFGFSSLISWHSTVLKYN